MNPRFNLLAIGIQLLFVACTSPLHRPPPLTTEGPDQQPLLVTATSHQSPWEWRIDTPSGPWYLTCRYKNDTFTAKVRFPDSKSLELPEKAVTSACRAISEAPEAAAWTSPDGTTQLSLGGTITLTTSQGIFTIRNNTLESYQLSETTAGDSEQNFQQTYYPDGNPAHP